jgi:hypothetical protein
VLSSHERAAERERHLERLRREIVDSAGLASRSLLELGGMRESLDTSRREVEGQRAVLSERIAEIDRLKLGMEEATAAPSAHPTIAPEGGGSLRDDPPQEETRQWEERLRKEEAILRGLQGPTQSVVGSGMITLSHHDDRGAGGGPDGAEESLGLRPVASPLPSRDVAGAREAVTKGQEGEDKEEEGGDDIMRPAEEGESLPAEAEDSVLAEEGDGGDRAVAREDDDSIDFLKLISRVRISSRKGLERFLASVSARQAREGGGHVDHDDDATGGEAVMSTSQGGSLGAVFADMTPDASGVEEGSSPVRPPFVGDLLARSGSLPVKGPSAETPPPEEMGDGASALGGEAPFPPSEAGVPPRESPRETIPQPPPRTPGDRTIAEARELASQASPAPPSIADQPAGQDRGAVDPRAEEGEGEGEGDRLPPAPVAVAVDGPSPSGIAGVSISARHTPRRAPSPQLPRPVCPVSLRASGLPAGGPPGSRSPLPVPDPLAPAPPSASDGGIVEGGVVGNEAGQGKGSPLPMAVADKASPLPSPLFPVAGGVVVEEPPGRVASVVSPRGSASLVAEAGAPPLRGNVSDDALLTHMRLRYVLPSLLGKGSPGVR